MTYNKNRTDGNAQSEAMKATNVFIPLGTVYPDEVIAWPGAVTAYMGEGTVWIENIVIDPNDW